MYLVFVGYTPGEVLAAIKLTVRSALTPHARFLCLIKLTFRRQRRGYRLWLSLWSHINSRRPSMVSSFNVVARSLVVPFWPKASLRNFGPSTAGNMVSTRIDIGES